MKPVIAVKDLAVDAFGNPFITRSENEAIRSFTDEVNGRGQPNSAVAAHPEDYVMYKIGEYDDNTGIITPCDPHEQLAHAKNLLIKEM